MTTEEQKLYTMIDCEVLAPTKAICANYITLAQEILKSDHEPAMRVKQLETVYACMSLAVAVFSGK